MYKNKKLGFLLFNQFEDLDFFGPWEIFGLWRDKFDGPELLLISEHGNAVNSSKGLSIQASYDFNNCPHLDMLLIPGGMGTRREVDNASLITFVEEQSVHCKYLLSVCTGAFILQKAGLLQNKKTTTHWASIERLKAFADVQVTQKRYTHDNNIWSSAGISAGIDMTLAFIAQVTNEKVAGDIQLWAEYYPSQTIYGSTDLPPYIKAKL